jgi:hypothetical protein
MRYLLRRFGFYVIAVWVSITINFFIPRLMAGDPVQIMFARFQGRLDPRSMDALYAAFGFVEGPLWKQYLPGTLLWGPDYRSRTLCDSIANSLAWTLRADRRGTHLLSLARLGYRRPERGRCGSSSCSLQPAQFILFLVGDAMCHLCSE